MSWDMLGELAGDLIGGATQVGVAKFTAPEKAETNTANPSKTVSESVATKAATTATDDALSKNQKFMIGGGAFAFLLLVLLMIFKK